MEGEGQIHQVDFGGEQEVAQQLTLEDQVAALPPEERVPALLEHIHFLTQELARKNALLNDPKRLITRALALRNGLLWLAVGILVALTLTTATPLGGILAGAWDALWHKPAAPHAVVPLPPFVAEPIATPSPALSPSPSPLPSQLPVAAVNPSPAPAVLVPPLPIATPSLPTGKIKHCPPPPDVPPRCLPVPT